MSAPTRSVLDLFDTVVRRAPHSVAVDGADGPVIYAELDRRARVLGTALDAAGVGPDDRVAFLGVRDARFPAVVLAVLRAGAVHVPLELDWPADRRREIVGLAAVTVAVVTAGAPEHLAAELGLTAVLVDTAAVLGRPTSPTVDLVATRPAYLTYTSGTTGEPKGVLTAHQALADLAGRLAVRLGVTDRSRVLQFHSASIDISLEELAIVWAAGGTTVTVSDRIRTDLQAFAAHLETHRVSVVDLPTSFWLVWLEAVERGEVRPPGADLSCVGVGSEAVPADAVERWLSVCGPGPGVYNLYGSTETGVTTLVDGPAVAGDTHDGPTIGAPMDGVHCYVLDEELRPVRPGGRGQLYLRGDIAALGYDGDPRTTAQAFVPDPFTDRPGQRMYAMGDEVSARPDGRFDYHGRVDAKLLVHGFTVHPTDVQRVIDDVAGVASSRVHTERSGPVTELVADLVPETTADDVVAGWREVYDALYAADAADRPAGLDTATWFSAVDGSPLPAATMAAWRDAVVAKILDLRPRRILELGCGTGMILHGVAGHVDRYVGVDFAPAALDAVRAGAATRDPGADVELIEADLRTALGAIDEQFDLVVANSVVQYLSDADELADLLELASARVAHGGRLLIGDVRNLALEDHYRAWLGGHDSHSTRGGRTGAEAELLLSPGWFAARTALGGRAVTAETTCKYVDDDSEMTLFRYDTVLHLDTDGTPSGSGLHAELPATSLGSTDLAAVVTPGAPVLVRDVRRFRPGRTDPGARRIAALRAELAEAGLCLEAAPGVTSALLVDLVVFRGPDRPLAMALLGSARPRDPDQPLANDPRAALDRELVQAVDAEVRGRLRAHERPARYRVRRGSRLVPVPVTRTGAAALSSADVEPATTSLEREIAAIWTHVLGQLPGPDDDFFDLGGNSLNLARVLVRMRSDYRIELTAQEFFGSPTVRSIAGLVSERAGTAAAPPAPLTTVDGTSGPASAAQERLWLLHQLSRASRAYHSPFVFDVDGPLDERALHAAAAAVTRTHPVLRTR